jgi:hypothetical protein
MTFGTCYLRDRHPHAQATFTLRNFPETHFLLVLSRLHVWSERNMSLKNPLTPSGIDPKTTKLHQAPPYNKQRNTYYYIYINCNTIFLDSDTFSIRDRFQTTCTNQEIRKLIISFQIPVCNDITGRRSYKCNSKQIVNLILSSSM